MKKAPKKRKYNSGGIVNPNIKTTHPVGNAYADGGMALQGAISGASTGITFGPWGAAGGALLGALPELLKKKPKSRNMFVENTLEAQTTAKQIMPEGTMFADGGKVGGKVVGPGTAKSDSVKTKIPNKSFIVPAENADKAMALRKAVGLKAPKIITKKKGLADGGMAADATTVKKPITSPIEYKNDEQKTLVDKAYSNIEKRKQYVKDHPERPMSTESNLLEDVLSSASPEGTGMPKLLKRLVETVHGNHLGEKLPTKGLPTPTHRDFKDGGKVDVNLSNGEHVFSPKEVDIIKKAGMGGYLLSLAPNAKTGNALKSGGTAMKLSNNQVQEMAKHLSMDEFNKLSDIDQKRVLNVLNVYTKESPNDPYPINKKLEPAGPYFNQWAKNTVPNSAQEPMSTGDSSPYRFNTSSSVTVDPNEENGMPTKKTKAIDNSILPGIINKTHAANVTSTKIVPSSGVKKTKASSATTASTDLVPAGSELRIDGGVYDFNNPPPEQPADKTDTRNDVFKKMGANPAFKPNQEEIAGGQAYLKEKGISAGDPELTKATTPPPSGGRNIIDKLGGAAGLFALGQTVFGLYQTLSAGKRPQFKTDPTLINQRDKAIEDASQGIDPAVEASAKDQIELNRRADLQTIFNASGGDTGTALSNMSNATNNSTRAITGLMAEKEKIRMEKNQRADILTGAVAAENDKGFEYGLKGFYDNQKAGADLMMAGISNFIGNKQYQSAEDRADARAKKYGTGQITSDDFKYIK
jgi:hypothetical protein